MHAAKCRIELLVEYVLDNLNHQHHIELLLNLRLQYTKKAAPARQTVTQVAYSSAGRLICGYLVTAFQEKVCEFAVSGTKVQDSAALR